VLLCILEDAEGALFLLEQLDVPELIRCVLLCMLEVLEGGLCLLEVLVVMRRLLCTLEAVEGALSFGDSQFSNNLAPEKHQSPLRG